MGDGATRRKSEGGDTATRANGRSAVAAKLRLKIA